MTFLKIKELLEAVEGNDLEAIKNFCVLPPEEVPDQKDIADAFQKAVTKGHLDIVKYLCELSTSNKPSQEAVSKALVASLKNTESDENIIKYLSLLPGDNKPDQSTIEQVMPWAVSQRKWGLLRDLSQLETNAPSKEKVGLVLVDIILNYDCKIAKLTQLCNKSTNKPGKTEINAALKAALKHNKWDYVQCLCCLTDENQPDQYWIEKALKRAVKHKKYELVRSLCSLKTDNAPKQDAVDKALETVSSSCSFPSFDLVEFLCKLKAANSPSDEGISKALLKAAAMGALSNIKRLCKLTAHNAPNQKSLDDALLKAAESKHLNVVLYLCQLNTVVKPGNDAIERSLRFIASLKNLNEIKKSNFDKNDEAVFSDFRSYVESTSPFDIKNSLIKLKAIQQVIIHPGEGKQFHDSLHQNLKPATISQRKQDSSKLDYLDRQVVSKDFKNKLIKAIDSYLNWMKQFAHGTRGFSRWSHWYHGGSGITRAEQLKALALDPTLTKSQIIDKLKEVLSQSSNTEHSLKTYISQAFDEPEKLTHPMRPH